MSHPQPEDLLTQPWSGQDHWTVLDTGFASAERFVRLWQRWREHGARPAMLHYVGVLTPAQALVLPALLRLDSSAAHCLAGTLADLSYDLEPGFQRILLEGGRLSLTLCVGDTRNMLARQELQANSIIAAAPEQAWDTWQLKALARCCKRGTQLLFCAPDLPPPPLLEGLGLVPAPVAPHATCMLATFNPRWQLRGRGNTGSAIPGRCAVVGAGIAGASVAHALATRGWQVDVYDAQAVPAAGASGLPVGLVVPHHSADDSPRSRLSRTGTRLMLAHAAAQLQTAQDWAPSGVLELSIAPQGLAEVEAELLAAPEALQASTAWARPMAYGHAQGLWHPHAAWVKPARLVHGWLQHPAIHFHGNAAVHSLEQSGQTWLLRNAQGQELGRADKVVFANAHGCVELLSRHAQAFPWLADVLPKVQAMQAMHGTLSLGPCPTPAGPAARAAMPPFPVNGHGSFVAGVPGALGPQWFAGSTFQSETARHADRAQEQAANFRKLQALLPAVAQALEPQFAGGIVQTWQGSRCVTHDRLPLVGPLDDAPDPSLWLCAGMGARGLSFSALCAELLAAWLGGEPLPVENNLAKSLSTRRLRRNRKGAQATGE
jgi:tRNA 5-methylaminomethyl-2-thiouridine biosynthesis bifunctional protein